MCCMRSGVPCKVPRQRNIRLISTRPINRVFAGEYHEGATKGQQEEKRKPDVASQI